MLRIRFEQCYTEIARSSVYGVGSLEAMVDK